jgi:hypothetical protein
MTKAYQIALESSAWHLSETMNTYSIFDSGNKSRNIYANSTVYGLPAVYIRFIGKNISRSSVPFNSRDIEGVLSMLGISLGLGNWALICSFQVTLVYNQITVSIHKKRIYSKNKMAAKIQ